MTNEKLQSIAETMLVRYGRGFRTEYDPGGRNVGHIGHMLLKLKTGQVNGDKAQRWLGYVQALTVFYGIYTLDELRELNKE